VIYACFVDNTLNPHLRERFPGSPRQHGFVTELGSPIYFDYLKMANDLGVPIKVHFSGKASIKSLSKFDFYSVNIESYFELEQEHDNFEHQSQCTSPRPEMRFGMLGCGYLGSQMRPFHFKRSAARPRADFFQLWVGPRIDNMTFGISPRAEAILRSFSDGFSFRPILDHNGNESGFFQATIKNHAPVRLEDRFRIDYLCHVCGLATYGPQKTYFRDVYIADQLYRVSAQFDNIFRLVDSSKIVHHAWTNIFFSSELMARVFEARLSGLNKVLQPVISEKMVEHYLGTKEMIRLESISLN
jgi:hypothetical protein